MFSPVQHHPAPARGTVQLIAPATAASTKLEKDTVYMPSSIAARVLGRAHDDPRVGQDDQAPDGLAHARER